MRCLYRCFLPRVKGRICDSGKVIVWKKYNKCVLEAGIIGSLEMRFSFLTKKKRWLVHRYYLWRALNVKTSSLCLMQGMGREGWHSQSSGLGKAHLWEYCERIRAGQGYACRSCGERHFVNHDSTMTRLWPARARLCFWEALWARSSSKVKAGAEE